MKNYTERINELEWKAVSTRDAMESLLTVIRKDVEEDETEAVEEMKKMRLEIEQLKEHINQQVEEKNRMQHQSGKSDNERLWDAILTERIVRSSASDAELTYAAKRLVNVWKEATK